MHNEKSGVSVILYCLLLSVMLGLVLTIFWFQQARFLRPTPVPVSHKEVKLGTRPAFYQAGLELKSELSLLHFYNPDCPCSRFNKDHFRDLLNTYGQEVGFYIVLQAPTEEFDEEITAGKLQVLVDDDGKIADLCGVYATPQAVVLDKAGSIVYRGNYNRARFCSSRDSWFAQMALDAKLNARPGLSLSEEAYVPYGCNLPSDGELLADNLGGLMNTIQQLIK